MPRINEKIQGLEFADKALHASIIDRKALLAEFKSLPALAREAAVEELRSYDDPLIQKLADTFDGGTQRSDNLDSAKLSRRQPIYSTSSSGEGFRTTSIGGGG